ncbi:acetolactate decarboxylase [Malacoplasma penetrans]|uniref:Alpha-acetolactate decarboxylase n=1 Tax=Malacoplasma penetrans (strain HF-2) TaxID=272633 RepID=Q8EVE0_MALP2|nr:acetolactate decarboxylase [Malacoplasma penetrans]RXY96098.1 acetolactate decarboxylase [Malacoplasma penetrans]BAC44414.1 alpha-acetolactate decarboxylase [Malacoplasma penetrans HF-2]
MFKSKAHAFSSINALSKGNYCSNFTAQEILKEGNFGIGAFESLNGELIIVHGKAYQIIDNTNVILCNSNVNISYAFVCNHDYKGFGYKFENLTKQSLENKLLKIFDTKNLIQAVYAKAIVKQLHSRTFIRQEKPYVEIQKIKELQSEIWIQNKEIELVGFYTPSLFSNFNIEGFHWHYISQDKDYGGHVIDMELESISLIIKPIHDLNYHSPVCLEFLELDLSENK